MSTDIELLPSSVAAFTEALKGERGSLDAWLEVNDEREVAAHVEAYASACVSSATSEKDAEIDALRTRLEDTVRDSTNKIETLRAALESLKAHKENAVMNRDGIIKALEEVRDEQGAEIHRLRAEVEIAKGQAEFYRTERNAQQRKAERLEEAKAKVSALRAELDRLRGEHVRVRRDRNAAQARAERLAEALRPLANLDLRPDGFDKRPDDQTIYARDQTAITVGHVRRAQAALHDHDQEVGNG